MSNLLKGCYYVISIFYLIGFIHPIILLGLAMVPPPLIYMFETKFHNLSNLSIGDFQGVTRITWGIWKACYYNDNTDAKSCTSLQWIAHPYTFVIIENKNQARATVQQTWLRVLFFQFVGFFYTLLIVVIHIIRYYHKKKLKEREESYKKGTGPPPIDGKPFWNDHRNLTTMRVTNILTASLGFMTATIIIANSLVLQSIKNEMQSLATGGITSVETKPGPGFWLNVTGGVLSIVVIFYISIRFNRKTDGLKKKFKGQAELNAKLKPKADALKAREKEDGDIEAAIEREIQLAKLRADAKAKYEKKYGFSSS